VIGRGWYEGGEDGDVPDGGDEWIGRPAGDHKARMHHGDAVRPIVQHVNRGAGGRLNAQNTLDLYRPSSSEEGRWRLL